MARDERGAEKRQDRLASSLNCINNRTASPDNDAGKRSRRTKYKKRHAADHVAAYHAGSN